MLLSMMSVAGVVLEKLTSSFQEVLGRGRNHTSKILSLQSKEVSTDVYWVKVKVLATLILMCDHSPQHANSNRRNAVYVCCSVLTILDVLKYVLSCGKYQHLFCSKIKGTGHPVSHDVGHAQFCVVMYNSSCYYCCYCNSCTFTLL